MCVFLLGIQIYDGKQMVYRAICNSHHPLFCFFQWRTTNLKVNLYMLFKRIKKTVENG